LLLVGLGHGALLVVGGEAESWQVRQGIALAQDGIGEFLQSRARLAISGE
jgi:hypothetical protein